MSSDIIAGTYRIPNDEGINKRLESADLFFQIIFTIEMVLKLFAYGWFFYLSDNFNKLDLLVVVAGYLREIDSLKDSNVSSIRTIRVLRPLRTINFLPGLRILVSTILTSIPMMFSVVLLCSIIFTVFAVVGVCLFGYDLDHDCVHNTGFFSHRIRLLLIQGRVAEEMYTLRR